MKNYLVNSNKINKVIVIEFSSNFLEDFTVNPIKIY